MSHSFCQSDRSQRGPDLLWFIDDAGLVRDYNGGREAWRAGMKPRNDTPIAFLRS